VVEWLTRSPAKLVKRMPSGAQVRILSLTHFFASGAHLFFCSWCAFRLFATFASGVGGQVAGISSMVRGGVDAAAGQF
jgi:hypothetical protein